jgi:TolB-like protein/Tfp pilus assembly protein PilF
MARASAALAELYSENENTRIAAARSQAQRALQLAPDSLEAGLAAATVELSLLKAEPAAIRTLLEGLLRRAPRDYRILILLAKTEGMNSDTPDALRWLADAEAAPGGKARSLLRQAWHYWGANRLRESLAAVERSLAAQPLTEAYNLKLMLLTVIGDSEGARQWLKRIPPMILREDRPAVIAYEALYYAHQPDEALRVVQAVPREILEEGRYFNVRALLAGEALLMAGKPRAAEIEFRAALKVIDERLAANPRHSRLWHERGQAQLYLGDRAAAEQSFITASELGGLSVTALAVQTQLLGKTEETLALIDRALQRTASRWPSALRRFKIHPVFAPLRENPRFQQLIARAESWLAEELQTAAAPPAVTASPFATPVKPDDKSIAVLAFANLSDDKANEYFSDGISEELLNVLAKVPGLKVPARTSAFSFKGKNTPVPEIAKQLGVAYVVDGSVRKAGEKVRITAQLIQAADGFHVWSDTFTRDLKDIFAVQDEIAGRIAAELSLKLGVTTAAAKTAVNPDAFELYVQARQAWNLRTPAGLEQAERLLHRALKLEPKWARAHAALADVWLSQAIERRKIGSFGQRHSPEFARLRAQVDRALALDPDLAEARATLGNLLQLSAQFEAGERELRRAVTLNPNYASGHQWLGRVLQSTARFDEAREALARAAALDPLSPRILDNYAALLQDVGRDAEAMALVERALVLQPDALQATMWKIMGLSTLGRHDEAVALLRRHPFDGTTYVAEALRVLVRAGLKAEAEQMLERNPDTDRFRALAAVGRPQDALDAVQLDRINILTFSLGFIDPDYDSLRQDPRYVSLLAQLGMTEAHARARTWRAAHPLPATPPQP